MEIALNKGSESILLLRRG